MHNPTITCSLCGSDFNPAGLQACSSCPLHQNCSMVCCPNCGHHNIDPSTSGLVRFISTITQFIKPNSNESRRLAPQGFTGQQILAINPQFGTAQSIFSEAPGKSISLDQAVKGDAITISGFTDIISPSKRAQLQSYGLTPGRQIKVLQQKPIFIIQVDYIELALERDIAKGVMVNPS